MNISIVTPSDADGLGLRGLQNIHVSASPRPLKIDLYIDSKLFASRVNVDSADFSWDTTKVANGTHVLRADGVYKQRRSRSQVAVTVKNSAVDPTTGRAYGSGSYGSGPYGG